MLTLYQYEMSPFCTKVALVLNAKHLPYRVVNVPIAESQKVAKFSPAKKLPSLEHDGRFVNDSTDIAYYLEEIFPERRLIPTQEPLWARCHLFEDWADESLNFYMMKLRWLPQNRARWANELGKFDTGVWRWLVTKFAAKAPLAILNKQGVGRKSAAAALKDIDRHIRTLSIELQAAEYLVGHGLSLADISVYVQLMWMRKNQEGKRIIDTYPKVVQWMERVDIATRKIPA